MAAPNRIFVSRSPGETRAALVAGDVVLEVVHLRDAEAQTGAVYAGHVGERIPGSSDVFVNIGTGAHGVLETKGHKLSAGQLIAVEVATPARADKGHKLKLSALDLPELVTAPSLFKPARHPVAAWWDLYKSTIQDVVVDSAAHRKALTQVLGDDAPVVTVAGNEMTFADIEDQIDDAMQPVVRLRSGGQLIIEPTSALIAIDIDAGASRIDQANTEAMSEIAHQLRLRNLAGHIVVDLIHTKAKQRFVEMLKGACAADPVDTRVMGFTPSGMIDIVRQRLRPSLGETLLNAETTAYKALRLACRELVARRAARVQLKLAPVVAALLNETLQGALSEARDVAKGDIVVVSQSSFSPDRIEIDS